MTHARGPAMAMLLGFIGLVLGADLNPARAASDRQALPRPLRVALVVEGEPQPVNGSLVAWDNVSVFVETDDGERTVAWRALRPAQAYDTARRLIAPKDSRAWVWLGLTMLASGDEALAKRAFDVACRLDSTLKPKSDEAIRLSREGSDPSQAFEDAPPPEQVVPESKEPPARRRRGVDPQGTQSGPARLWPALTEEQAAQHTRTIKDLCAEYLSKTGMSITPVETEVFLFYSDLSRPETDRWAGELDRMYATLLSTLEIPKGTRLFQGKAPIFIFRDQDRYLAFERAAFNFNAENTGGVNHQRNGYTFTSFFKGSDDRRFNSTLIHETVHAFMYRYRSPAPLPTWANEGLADYVAGHLVVHSDEPLQHWQHTRNFVNARGDPLTIMRQSYTDGSWFTDDSYPVSHMLVRFMLKHKPRAFKEWIDDIKDGKNWKESLADRFNVSPETLASGFARDISSEPGYERLR